MQNNRPVFESFDEFVQFVYEAVQLNEADTSYASPLFQILKGGMKLDGESSAVVNTLIKDSLNKYFTDVPFADIPGEDSEKGKTGKTRVDELVDYLKETFDLLNNSAGLATVPGDVVASPVDGVYQYLVNGTVRVKDAPEAAQPSGITEGTFTMPLTELLGRLALHNFFVLYELVSNAGKKKGFTNSGTEAKVKDYVKFATNYAQCRFLAIDPASLNGDMIIFKPYVAQPVKDVEYAWQFPIYGILPDAIQPGDQVIDANYYDEVIAPAGNSVQVKLQEYNAPDVKFFAENGVTISEEGKRQLKSVLSEYNSIETITVNGGASSKPTSYKSKSGEGNPALATDRMNAGLAELNALKKSGVAQLANTKIEAGKAEVQPEGEKSDATKQQVSFIISGMIKSVETVPTAPVVIKNTEEIKANKVTFTQYTFQVNLNEEPNDKNMEARA